MPRLETVWEFKISPSQVLMATTLVTILLYILYLVYAINIIDEQSLPSLSHIIAYSRGTTITYTIILFIHGYSVSSYLVIASEYIGIQSPQFFFIAFSSCMYLICLLLISYLPLTEVRDTHNIFAILAFIFALFSILLHRNVPNGDYGPETWLLLIEGSILFTVLLLGIFFWFNNSMLCEYIFVGFVIVDKYIKVLMLEVSGLLDIDDSYIQYKLMSVPNRPTTDNYVL